ncbi:MAG TPA: sugar ABC transporter ATP-binding protein [Hungateiclostridium thermocellum]|jgi:ribose transport system ATP-binding protein|uniref:ABC transporter related protein n=3 Tax=Acetivibrio thermocellus TaxID=1515 RepID=A3DCF0_ACET2|nr:sugar ABC transporter ATP-binding protein [Acetivibrio thermocellus]ABN51629.1 ABC transporter related protein [Acetivibrio thermocellus ATCC 27405]ADU74886.1 ABC transporter related protein [Acetivibrio thermocellus DSM 1313]ALX08841.1 Monosaccharide-transporting ATPase [Acetivibrio thermocellus AD2]ANV76591.1 Monosaccharide-transporting ATPase [Acetivibrio thermocellus DSM 2360]EIC05182.1 ABC transporter related protein [Acetivibrio thermocellus YS]
MDNALLLEVKGLSKVFPGTRALNRVSLEVRKGEVHGLCGENGAGKSTLMNIVGGVFPATEGIMKFDGKIFNPKNPKDSQDAGIGFVHQELCLCPHLSAAENIFIGRLPSKGDKIDFKKLYEDADAILKTLDANFSSKTLVSNLTVSEQQLVEIAKSISLNCKLLILDEPTSSLTDKETARLFQVVRDLKKKGISILFISHRMKEVFEICDRVTVLKDGSYVCCMNISEITHEDVIRAMVGRDLGELYPPKSSKIEEDNYILKVENLSGNGFENVSFTLKKGEILGFAGLVGAGRSEVMRGLCAIDPVKRGEVYLNGEKQKFKRYKDAVKKGICYLTEDRKNSGLFLHMSIAQNISSANLEAVSKRGWIIKKREYSLSEKYVKALSIKIPGLSYPISNLSGGNQQKCLIGKWLSTNPKVIIMDEPTRGIDVGAKREIHNLLRSLSEQGVGVIIVSSELPEIIGVADRIAVMHEGRLAGFLQGEQVSEENIMKLASGANLS